MLAPIRSVCGTWTVGGHVVTRSVCNSSVDNQMGQPTQLQCSKRQDSARVSIQLKFAQPSRDVVEHLVEGWQALRINPRDEAVLPRLLDCVDVVPPQTRPPAAIPSQRQLGIDGCSHVCCIKMPTRLDQVEPQDRKST